MAVDSYTSVPRPSTLASRAELLHDARAIMREDYADELTLDDVAARIATSRRQLQRVFAELAGTGFREELAAIRMDRAAELLHGPLPVGEIARRVGYRQSAQFAKAFRAHHGMVPSEYRAMVRGGAG
ncbi:MAG TPA: helix-turn-helix transcriptional regulator [Solirubrobacteraceae bacterium]|nr:helix-turn-helix transcriptional regulator [Solirubrobacteraceae bacterium]